MPDTTVSQRSGRSYDWEVVAALDTEGQRLATLALDAPPDSPLRATYARRAIRMQRLRDRAIAGGRGERSDQTQTLAPAGAVSATEQPTPERPRRGRA